MTTGLGAATTGAGAATGLVAHGLKVGATGFSTITWVGAGAATTLSTLGAATTLSTTGAGLSRKVCLGASRITGAGWKAGPALRGSTTSGAIGTKSGLKTYWFTGSTQSY